MLGAEGTTARIFFRNSAKLHQTPQSSFAHLQSCTKRSYTDPPNTYRAVYPSKMAPKPSGPIVSRGQGRTTQKPTFLQSAYQELTASENQSVIRSVVMFGVSSCMEFTQRASLALTFPCLFDPLVDKSKS